MELAELAQRQGGVFTRRQAIACSLSKYAVNAALSSGRWRQVYPDHRGVFADATLPLTRQSYLWAGVLVVGEPCAIAVATAAACWGWTNFPDQTAVVVEPSRRPRPPRAVTLHRMALSDRDVARRRWLPITTPVRTLVDCLRFLPPALASDVFDRSQQRGGPSPAAVLRALPATGAGKAQATEVLSAADGALFVAEKLAVRLLRESAITGWRANHSIKLHGNVVIVDIAFVAVLLAIEIDGFAFHSSPERFQRDRNRQNALIAAGW
ncbi:MAG: type IV toxin-antitoxin system AbiEi family antitoxin domain-containing protein, partial [Candidatus Nanopelagicales bacterium]